jgi:protein TonB
LALAAHAGVAVMVLAWVRPAEPPIPDPVVLVELPPPSSPEALARSTPQPLDPQTPQPMPHAPVTPLPDVPLARLPVPDDAVTLPRNEPQRASHPAASGPAEPAAQPRQDQGGGDQAGNDPAAQKAEADYKSLVGGHIRRNRFSPPQSKKAGLSGTVKVRFVVDRKGGISAVSVAGSSGHGLLDSEAVQFIQKLSPVPAFPRDLRKAEIPLTITLKFDLERK